MIRIARGRMSRSRPFLSATESQQNILHRVEAEQRAVTVIKVKKAILLAAILYLAYVVCTAALPYVRPKEVSDSFAGVVADYNFYGASPCTDRVALVEYPSDSLEARLHILDEAERTIDVSYYAIHMGETADIFLGALLHAAERGVQVRILVDGVSGGLTSRHSAEAVAIGAHPNIELRLYNRMNVLKPWTWNGRLHDKYIIVDDRLLLLGGRNIGDKYFAPESYDGKVSYDRDVLVYNTQWLAGGRDSVLFDVRDYMDSIWNGEDVSEPFSKDSDGGGRRRQELVEMYLGYRAGNPQPFDHSGDDYEAMTYPANKITFIHNDTNIGQKEPKAGYVLAELLLDAEESVIMQSPYVILDGDLQDLLDALGSGEVDANILTNSMYSSSNPLAHTAYHSDRREIAESGVGLWEYQGENVIHAKTYLIDDRMAVIGSYNLDPRSAYIDTELLLAIDSPEFTRYVKKVQSEYFSQSLQVSPDGDYFPGQVASESEPSMLKTVMIYALMLPVVLFKFLI